MSRLLIYTLLALCLTDCGGCAKTGEQGPASRRTRRPGSTATQTQPDQTKPANPQPTPTNAPKPTLEVAANGPNEVQMTEAGGVFTVPVRINEVPMNFIFDTGASLISISETEAGFLYKQGTIDPADIIGKGNFTDANGDVSEGTIINLRSVQIGNRILHNVRASVVAGGAAPLLLGQSALGQFGKLSIDYQRKTIAFE
jgi:aspartyl protease family protein